jgi:hypothetical protein
VKSSLLTYLLTNGAEPFLRSWQLGSHARTSQRFMQPEVSLPCSQEPFFFFSFCGGTLGTAATTGLSYQNTEHGSLGFYYFACLCCLCTRCPENMHAKPLASIWRSLLLQCRGFQASCHNTSHDVRSDCKNSNLCSRGGFFDSRSAFPLPWLGVFVVFPSYPTRILG